MIYRYTDFLVNEILPSGQVVHLDDVRAPRPVARGELLRGDLEASSSQGSSSAQEGSLAQESPPAQGGSPAQESSSTQDISLAQERSPAQGSLPTQESSSTQEIASTQERALTQISSPQSLAAQENVSEASENMAQAQEARIGGGEHVVAKIESTELSTPNGHVMEEIVDPMAATATAPRSHDAPSEKESSEGINKEIQARVEQARSESISSWQTYAGASPRFEVSPSSHPQSC